MELLSARRADGFAAFRGAAETLPFQLMNRADPKGCYLSRRQFLKSSALLGGSAAFAPRLWAAGGQKPLFAYVGTFSSPLHDVLPAQVDQPPGNGRGIHHFQVDRSTGA